LRGLSRRLRRLELHLLDRLLHLGRRACHLLLRGRGSLCQETRGRRQSLGRGGDHARMDALLAAALPPVHGTAADPVEGQRGKAPSCEGAPFSRDLPIFHLWNIAGEAASLRAWSFATCSPSSRSRNAAVSRSPPNSSTCPSR